MCGGVYAAIREQASDWSRPEAEEDAPRLTRERIFYDPLVRAHTARDALAACLDAAKIRLAPNMPLSASSSDWFIRSISIPVSCFLRLSLFCISSTRSYSRRSLTLSARCRLICYDLITQKRPLPVSLASRVHNSKVSAIYLAGLQISMVALPIHRARCHCVTMSSVHLHAIRKMT